MMKNRQGTSVRRQAAKGAVAALATAVIAFGVCSASDVLCLVASAQPEQATEETADPTSTRQGTLVLEDWGAGERLYFLWDDGTVAAGETIRPENGTGHYLYAKPDGTIVLGESYNDGSGYVYVADEDGRLPDDVGWSFDGGKLRYIDEETHGAKTGCFEVDGKHYFGLDDGSVLIGKLAVGDVLLVAGADGALLWGYGWHITSAYDDETRKYYVRSSSDGQLMGAPIGEFEVNGDGYVAVDGEGYVATGYEYVLGEYLYVCDEEGRVTSKEGDTWFIKGTGTSTDVHNSTALAKLAIRVAVTTDLDGDRVYSPTGSEWDKCDDPRAQEYFEVCEKSTKRYDWAMGGNNAHHENVAYASCTQAVAMIVRATVDPDMWMIGPGDLHEYCETSSKWDCIGSLSEIGKDGLQPGDVLCDPGDNHTALYVGNELVREMYPSSNADVYEAHGSLKSYPELSAGTLDGGYDYVVYRFNGTLEADLPFFNPWKLLRGDIDWDNC